MPVDFDSFVEWCEDRFPGEVQVKGKEVKLKILYLRQIISITFGAIPTVANTIGKMESIGVSILKRKEHLLG